MEGTPSEQSIENPTHPYKEALLSAIPSVDPESDATDLIILKGDIPGPACRPVDRS